MNDDLSNRLSPEELERLHDQHADSLLRFLQRLTGNMEDAHDCLQMTFMILQEKGGLCLPEARKAWLFRVAHNEAQKLFREQGLRRKQWQQQVNERQTEDHESAIDAMVHQERLARVREAIEQLPSDLQAVVQLRMVEGLRFREIAERLQLPLGTALSRMHQALAKLSEKLSD